jgi:phage shock protein E
MKRVLFVLLASLFYCAQGAYADPVWIDVRSVEEYSADHIDGDANIPLAAIDAQALADKYGKDAELMLYCRSGNRAGQAQEILKAAGFTNVTNAGGITDVRTLRGIAVQSPAAPAEQAAPAAAR